MSFPRAPYRPTAKYRHAVFTEISPSDTIQTVLARLEKEAKPYNLSRPLECRDLDCSHIGLKWIISVEIVPLPDDLFAQDWPDEVDPESMKEYQESCKQHKKDIEKYINNSSSDHPYIREFKNQVEDAARHLSDLKKLLEEELELQDQPIPEGYKL